MNNGIFGYNDRRISSAYFGEYSCDSQIQNELREYSLPLKCFDLPHPIPTIGHFPPFEEWKIDLNSFVYVFDTSLLTYSPNGINTAGTGYDTIPIIRLWLGQENGGTVQINWGDGTIEDRSFGNFDNRAFITHIYRKHGIYVVQIRPITAPVISSYRPFAGTPSQDTRDGKLLGILNLPPNLTSFNGFLLNCNRCDFVPTFLSPQVTSLAGMFQWTSNVKLKNIGLWDIKNVTSIAGMFDGHAYTTIFNEDLSAWNTSNITNMSSTFANNTAFNNGGSSGINDWNTSNVTNMSRMFGTTWKPTYFNQPIGNWNTSKVTDMSYMFGSTDGQAGVNGGDRAFNQDIGAWNTSGVTNMAGMFYGAVAFNNGGSSSISGWNTSACTNMSQMFKKADAFNQPIGSWNTSGVTNMSEMFFTNTATPFNQNLGSWNTSNVTNMRAMFQGRTNFIGSGLNNWDTSKVTNMSNMFLGCSQFVGSGINNWNTSNVTSTAQMFNGCGLFNQPIGSWDMSKVTSFNSMLATGGFNQDIGSWNVSSGVDFTNLFYTAGSFNNGGSPSISGWNVSNATTMQNMFFVALAFNQPLTGWDTKKVTNMNSAFGYTYSFQQPLSHFNLAGLNSNTSLDNFMFNRTTSGNAYSTANYDDLLIAWNNNKSTPTAWRSDLRPNFGAAKYTAGGAAATARAALVAYGWTITDGGSV